VDQGTRLDINACGKPRDLRALQNNAG